MIRSTIHGMIHGTMVAIMAIDILTTVMPVGMEAGIVHGIMVATTAILIMAAT